MKTRRVLAGLAMALGLVGGLAAGAGATAAHAATITRTFDFTLGGFGAGAPYQTYAGSFTVTWDATQDYANETLGLVENSLTGPVDQGVGFNYYVALDRLILGGLAGGVSFLQSGNDFGVNIAGASGGSPTILKAGYTFPSRGTFLAQERNLSVSAVPEPGGWTVMILGLGGVGAVLRSRRAVRRLAA